MREKSAFVLKPLGRKAFVTPKDLRCVEHSYGTAESVRRSNFVLAMLLGAFGVLLVRWLLNA